MISIVICHRNERYLATITENIKNTIGVNYELIVIDNCKNIYSIFEAYNIGVSKSNYDIICFSHEDVLFHTVNWGQNVVNHFKDETIGMLGVVGGNVFPKSPSPWWSNEIVNDHLLNIIQHWQGSISKLKYHQILSKKDNEIITKTYNNPFNQLITDAVVLDGLWFCIRKELFDSNLIHFDSDTFKGFHCYDSDISLQVIHQQKRVCVIYDNLIEHFQQGTINKSWFESVILLNRKWRTHLPVSTKKIDDKLYGLYEWETLRTFIYWIESAGFSEKEIRALIFEVSAFLKIDDYSKKVSNELIYRAKFGKLIGRVINKIKIIV
jgi:hypothetical protein